jgi:UDP-N-acetylglucosamine 3-dehydrogenase
VIGTGAMGQHHLRIYGEMRDVELVGLCDVDRNRAESLAIKHNTTPYFDHMELLRQDLDAVSVVVPTTLHTSIALDVINSETHLIVEN